MMIFKIIDKWWWFKARTGQGVISVLPTGIFLLCVVWNIIMIIITIILIMIIMIILIIIIINMIMIIVILILIIIASNFGSVWFATLSSCHLKPLSRSCILKAANVVGKLPMHYWLRESIGFEKVQKVGQSRHLFLIH